VQVIKVNYPSILAVAPDPSQLLLESAKSNSLCKCHESAAIMYMNLTIGCHRNQSWFISAFKLTREDSAELSISDPWQTNHRTSVVSVVRFIHKFVSLDVWHEIECRKDGTVGQSLFYQLPDRSSYFPRPTISNLSNYLS
jgi:hypothetical protein